MNRKAGIVRKRRGIRDQGGRDRRVRRTARALTHALVSLVLEKRYDAITVQDLLDRADVGRSTFYSHYRGKDDLLLRSFEQMLDMFDRGLGTGSVRLFPVEELFQHVGAMRHFYQALGRARVLDRQYQVAIERLSLSFERRLAHPDRPSTATPPSVAARSLAGALCALLRWWIETDTPYGAGEVDRMFHLLAVSA